MTLGPRLKRFGTALLVIAALVYINNASFLAEPIGDGPVLLAHRGLAQGFERAGLTGKTCTASRMIRAPHDFLENTIASMRAAFELGADVVEFDVHRTTDGRMAVFHDWTVDCRTEGTGVTNRHSLAELQALDIGYGYTADGGRTWPFRGKGVGLMPSLDEVLDTFHGKSFLINLKSNDVVDGELLAARLAVLPRERLDRIMVYGGSRPVSVIAGRLTEVRTLTRPGLKHCLVRYLALGWSGYLPADCRHTVVMVPANYASWMWGWPNRFLRRMHDAGTRVFLIGDYGGGGFSRGFDDPARLKSLPADYSGGISTDRIDLIAPAVRNRADAAARVIHPAKQGQ